MITHAILLAIISKIMMSSSSDFNSPNAIPPRRSSTGLGGATYVDPTKPILKPVPESNWIAQGSKHSSSMATDHHLSSLDGGADVAIHANGSTWSKEKEKIVLGPFDYMSGHPGKDIRTQFIAAFNAWLKVPPESLAIITKVVGMLHTASLL